VTRKPTPAVDVRIASGAVRVDDGFGSFFQWGSQPGWGSQPQPQPVDPRRGGRQYYRQVQPVQQGWGW
jgi:hypothetical protein